MKHKQKKTDARSVVVRNRPYGILTVMAFFLAAVTVAVRQWWGWCLGCFAVTALLTFLIRDEEVLEISRDGLVLYLRDSWGNVQKQRVTRENLISWSVQDENNRLRISYYDPDTASAKMQVLTTANLMGISQQMNRFYRDKLNSKRLAGELVEKLHEFRRGLFYGKKRRG